MSTKDQVESKVENLELLMSQLIEQQQTVADALTNVGGKIGQLHQEITLLRDRVGQVKVELPPVNLEPVRAEVNRGVHRLAHAIREKPQSIVRKLEILLFPPQDAKLFYKIVFGRWLVWLAVIIGIMCVYNYSVRWQNNKTSLEVLRLEKAPIIMGWQHLYDKSGKKLRQEMDSILLKAAKPVPLVAPDTSANIVETRATRSQSQ